MYSSIVAWLPSSSPARLGDSWVLCAGLLQAAIAQGSAREEQLQQLIFDIATASRNLVKNQTTWFRDDELFR
jgi:hypothetical protein